jgi:hypothetical protein
MIRISKSMHLILADPLCCHPSLAGAADAI